MKRLSLNVPDDVMVLAVELRILSGVSISNTISSQINFGEMKTFIQDRINSYQGKELNFPKPPKNEIEGSTKIFTIAPVVNEGINIKFSDYKKLVGYDNIQIGLETRLLLKYITPPVFNRIIECLDQGYHVTIK